MRWSSAAKRCPAWWTRPTAQPAYCLGMALVRLFWNWPKMCRLPSRWARGERSHPCRRPRSLRYGPDHDGWQGGLSFCGGNHAALPANRVERSQKTLADLDWVVCHQANSRIIDHCIKHLHAEPSKFYKNMDRHGNTSAASIPIALNEMVENDLLHPGQTLACIGFGGGLTWGGMLLTYEGRR